MKFVELPQPDNRPPELLNPFAVIRIREDRDTKRAELFVGPSYSIVHTSLTVPQVRALIEDATARGAAG